MYNRNLQNPKHFRRVLVHRRRQRSAIQTFRRLHQFLTGSEQLYFDGVFIHARHLGQLLYRVTFHFFQQDQMPVLFGDLAEQFDQIIVLRQFLVHRHTCSDAGSEFSSRSDSSAVKSLS